MPLVSLFVAEAQLVRNITLVEKVSGFVRSIPTSRLTHRRTHRQAHPHPTPTRPYVPSRTQAITPPAYLESLHPDPGHAPPRHAFRIDRAVAQPERAGLRRDQQPWRRVRVGAHGRHRGAAGAAGNGCGGSRREGGAAGAAVAGAAAAMEAGWQERPEQGRPLALCQWVRT